jgi:hypothetical protein
MPNPLPHFDRFFAPEELQRRRLSARPKELRQGPIFTLTRDDEIGRYFRCLTNLCLEVGFRHSAIDRDLEARLRSSKWQEFIQAHNELHVAYFFEHDLKMPIRFRSPGGGASVLEFEAQAPDGAFISVEVKTACQEVPKGVFHPRDGRIFRGLLKRGYEQIPKDGSRTLIVVCPDLGYLSQPHREVAALFGPARLSFKVDMSIGEAVEGSESSTRRDAFWTRDSNRHLSGVGVLENYMSPEEMNFILATQGEQEYPRDAPTSIPFQKFRLYHNPFALSRPLPAAPFDAWPQFVPDKSTSQMKWLGNPEERKRIEYSG